MRAVAIDRFGGPETLGLRELPRPKPAADELLVRVVAAGVNPVDALIREGRLADALPHRFPLVPGWDVAGVVEELGPRAAHFRKGDRVFACAKKSVVQWGTYADYVTVPEAQVAPMPARLLFEEAAGVPVAALTAGQALAAGGLAAGQTVLIHAAAGGVGHFAVQLARLAGARVIGTASPAHQAFVLGSGAVAVIDHTGEDFVEALKRHAPDGAQLVIDAVGGDTLARSYAAVARGGCLVTIAGAIDPSLAERHGIRAIAPEVTPDGGRLREIANLFDRKELSVHVEKIYPLARAAEAHERSATRRVQGKLVLNL